MKSAQLGAYESPSFVVVHLSDGLLGSGSGNEDLEGGAEAGALGGRRAEDG